MKNKSFAFTIDTLEQAEKIILESRIYNFKPIFHFKSYIIEGFGFDFISSFKKILYSKYGKSSFKLFVDCGCDHGLCISMITKKIDYTKLKGNNVILSKIRNIANKNRVLLNQSFNIVDCRNRKNIKSKMKEICLKGIK